MGKDSWTFIINSLSLMKKIITWVFLLTLVNQTLSSQVLLNACESSPCQALPLCSTDTLSNPNSYSSAGNPIGTCGSSFFSGNWVYYRFTCYATGDLLFHITPNDITSDINWAVWNITSSTCSALTNVVGCNADPSIGTVVSGNLSLVSGASYLVGIQRASGGLALTGFHLSFNGTTALISNTTHPYMAAIVPFNVCAPVNSIDVKMSEPVQCAQLSTDDFVITNNPSFTVNSLSCSGCNNSTSSSINYSMISDTIHFAFSGSLAPGNYTIQFNAQSTHLPSNICGQGPDTSIMVQFTVPMPISINTVQSFNCQTQTYIDTIKVTGGIAPYNYRVKGGTQTNTYSGINIVTGLVGGITYTVYVKDNNNCENSIVITHIPVNPLSPPSLASSASPPCFNQFYSDSISSPSIIGGLSPYNVTISSTPASATIFAVFYPPLTWKNLVFNTGATFTVTVTDALGCSVSKTKSLINPSQLIVASPTITNPVCPNNSSGSLTVMASGGTGPWNYTFTPLYPSMMLSNSSPSHLNNQVTGLSAGTYTITTTDSHGCMATNLASVNLLGITLSDTMVIHCGSYTWPGNGMTYSTSGIYSYLDNCVQHHLNLTVNPIPSVSAPNVTFCNTAATLGGLPLGGVWSLPNPYSGNASSYTYYYTNSFGCQDSANGNIIFLGAVGNVQTSNVTGVSAMLSWSGLSPWYEIRYKPINSSAWTTVSSSVNNKPLNGLQSSTTYTVEVRGFCNSSTSGPWMGHLFNTNNSCGIPSALSVINLSSMSAKLKWSAVSGANYYKVRRRAVGAMNWIVGTSTTNSKLVTGLIPSTTYEFQVSTNCGSPGGSVNTAFSPSFLWTTPILKPNEIEEEMNMEENSIYPNPMKDILHFKFTRNQKETVLIKLMDMNGRLVKIQQTIFFPGENELEMNVQDLAPGVYTLMMFQDEEVCRREKLLKME